MPKGTRLPLEQSCVCVRFIVLLPCSVCVRVCVCLKFVQNKAHTHTQTHKHTQSRGGPGCHITLTHIPIKEPAARLCDVALS